MTRAFQDHQIRQYLLGGLPAEEESALEAAYFGDLDLLARVELAREDLVDDYAAVRLSPADRERFERRILATPEGREQVAIAKALRKASGVDSKNGSGAAPERTSGVVLEMPPRPAWRVDRRWLALAAAIPLAIGVFLAWRILMGPTGVTDQVNTPGQQTRQSEPSEPISPSTADPRDPQAPSSEQPRPSAPPEGPATVLATLILTADLTRSAGQPPTLQTSTGVTDVDVVAPREGLSPGTAPARVDTVEGVMVWSGAITVPAANAQDPRPHARVPVSLLPPGDYFFVIDSGRTGAADELRYYFRVRAR